MEPNFNFELESRNIHSMAHYAEKMLIDKLIDDFNLIDESDRSFYYYIVAVRPKKCRIRKWLINELRLMEKKQELILKQTKLF